METKYCTVERDGHLTIVTLARPEVMNALHKPADDELDRVWDDFAADPDQWIAIVTGAGDRAFCAGNDLKFQARAEGPRRYPKSGFCGLPARFDPDKPVIAAVNGVPWEAGSKSRSPATSSLRRKARALRSPNLVSEWRRSQAGCIACRAQSASNAPWASC